MRVIFKSGLAVLIPEAADEGAELAAWSADKDDHVFRLTANAAEGAVLHDLGPREEVCREPINITQDAPPPWNLISNLAHTPFELDGYAYASVEGFWQGLKFDDPAERDRIASLYGGEAKHAGDSAGLRTHVTYRGYDYAVGTHAHWELMRRACYAKFTSHGEAREALLSTGTRPLVHRVRKDSKTIPGVIMAEIWMAIRAELARR